MLVQRLGNVGTVLVVMVSLLTCTLSEAAERNSFAFSFYQGQGVDANLLNILPDLVRGDLHFEDTYFTAVGYHYSLRTPDGIKELMNKLGIPDTHVGIEVIAAKHYGLQHDVETDVLYLIRFPRLAIYVVTVRCGAGAGISYAFGRPSYEDGPIDDPNKRYRFQSYEAFELEWGYKTAQRINLVTRIHHRSGVYGLIAPRHVGSNFMTIGVRYSF